MYAIVSLLDAPHYTEMEDLWRELESECGLAGISFTPLPHFSWHLAAEYDFNALENALEKIAIESAPFTIRATGLGLFTGPSPVLFIPLVKNQKLASFHQCVWENVYPLAVSASSHYAPEVWVPHITVGYGDVSPIKLGCAMEKLAFRFFDWEIQVDHIALVYQHPGQVGKLHSKHVFQST